jgi:putative DNA primase/helicase
MNPFDRDTPEYEAYEASEAADAIAGLRDYALPALTDIDGELAGMDAATRKDMARSWADKICRSGAGEAEILSWRDTLRDSTKIKLSGRDFDAIRAAVKRDQRKARRTAAMPDAVEGKELSAPGAPMNVGRELVKEIEHTDGVPHLTWWRGDFYRWDSSRFNVVETYEIDRWLYLQTENAYYVGQDEDGPGRKPWHPTQAKINSLSQALGRGILQHIGEPEKCIALQNGVLELGALDLQPHTPARFNLYSLPFDYDASAVCHEWMKFLHSVLPGDEEAHEFLQEWFGYVISGRTDLQKMASLVGPPRCGKGTIARVLTAVLGKESVTSPTLSALASQFGKQSLIGKQLAILSDVRWTARNAAEATEPLLAITGEDAQSVPRKNKEDWEGKLDVRFMAMSNDVPIFKDSSAALANRMIHIEFTTSFLGKEDIGLTERLLEELPGILNWALEGLSRLTARGYFKAPASSTELANEVVRAASPFMAFVEDWCFLDDSAETNLDTVYSHYKDWCASQGRDLPGTKAAVSRGLQNAYRGKLATDRRMEAGVRHTYLVGLRIRPGAMFEA